MQLDNRAYEFMKQAKQQGISKEEVFSLLQSKGYDLGLNAQPAPQQTAQPSQDNYSGLDRAKYIGRAGAEGLTFGMGDIVGGLTNTIVAPIGKTVNTIREGAPLSVSDFNPIQNFKEGRGDFVREQQQFAQAHPVLNFVGELGGGLITGAAGAGKKLITTAGKQGLKSLAKEGAREGSKFGLAYGAGSGLTQDAEKLSVSNALKGGAEGLVTGAALGAAAPVAVTGTGRGVQRFLGTKGYAKRAAEDIFKEAGGKEIGQVVRTEKGTRALKEAIKADDKVARAVRDVSDQKLIDSADKTKDIINNTLGVDNIVNARNQARAFYDDVVNNSTTKIPQSIYSNKGTQEALSKAIAEDYSGELAKKGPNSLAVAQKAKEKLDDMIEASYEIGDYGVRKPTSKTQDLIAVKNAFVRQLDAIAPEYKMAREQFTKAVKPYDLLEGLTKTTGRERANTIKSVLTNKNKEAISSVFGKEKAGQLFDTLRDQSIENERFNKLYNAAENKLTKETPKTQGLIREALESFGSIVGNAVDMARIGGATRGRRRIGEILLGIGKDQPQKPRGSVLEALANKMKEEGGYAMNDLSKSERKAIRDIIKAEQEQIGKGYNEVLNNPLKGTAEGKYDVLAELKPSDITYLINRGAAIKDPKTGDIIVKGRELAKQTGTSRNFGFSKMIFGKGLTKEEMSQLPKLLREYKPVEVTERSEIYRIDNGTDTPFKIVFSKDAGPAGKNALVHMSLDPKSKGKPFSIKKDLASQSPAIIQGKGYAVASPVETTGPNPINSIGKKGQNVKGKSVSKILRNKESK